MWVYEVGRLEFFLFSTSARFDFTDLPIMFRCVGAQSRLNLSVQISFVQFTCTCFNRVPFQEVRGEVPVKEVREWNTHPISSVHLLCDSSASVAFPTWSDGALFNPIS